MRFLDNIISSVAALLKHNDRLEQYLPGASMFDEMALVQAILGEVSKKIDLSSELDVLFPKDLGTKKVSLIRLADLQAIKENHPTKWQKILLEDFEHFHYIWVDDAARAIDQDIKDFLELHHFPILKIKDNSLLDLAIIFRDVYQKKIDEVGLQGTQEFVRYEDLPNLYMNLPQAKKFVTNQFARIVRSMLICYLTDREYDFYDQENLTKAACQANSEEQLEFQNRMFETLLLPEEHATSTQKQLERLVKIVGESGCKKLLVFDFDGTLKFPNGQVNIATPRLWKPFIDLLRVQGYVVLIITSRESQLGRAEDIENFIGWGCWSANAFLGMACPKAYAIDYLREHCSLEEARLVDDDFAYQIKAAGVFGVHGITAVPEGPATKWEELTQGVLAQAISAGVQLPATTPQRPNKRANASEEQGGAKRVERPALADALGQQGVFSLVRVASSCGDLDETDLYCDETLGYY